jgi:hypothetical protein
MSIESVEKVETNIVVLPSGDFEINLSPKDLADIVKEPELDIAPAPISLARITSLSDQVEIRIGQGRIHISDHSNSQPGTERFTDIICGLTSLLEDTSNVKYRAFGWNYGIAFKLPLDRLPSEVIAERFINREEIMRKAGLDIAGGALRFFYRKGSALCYLHLEPRGGRLDADLYYARVNVHFDITEKLPAKDELDRSFKHEYADFLKTVSAILD